MNNISNRKPLIIFIILLLIFLIPMWLAWYMVSKDETLERGTVNRGALIQPPRSLSQLDLKTADGQIFNADRKWLMLYVNPNLCDATCEKMLYNMRQVRLATGKDMDRLQRVVVTFQGTQDPKIDTIIQTDFSGTIHTVVNKEQFQKTMGSLDSTKLALTQGYLYLVDPLGNIMMGYSINTNPSNVFKDLQRLLKVSQIG